MAVTIFSVVPKRLVQEAERIKKHAEDQLEAWLVLGQSEKYAKAIDQAGILRLAANEQDVYTRRQILKNAGFIVKNLDKTRKENPTMKPASPAQIAARKRFAEMARSGAFKKKTTRRKANPVDTYIEKFHLGGKIYAQIIEKSDGTFDYYVYQMQATGIPGEKPYEQFFESKNYKTKSGAMRGLEKWAARHQYKVTPQLHTNPAKKTVSQKISQLRHEGYPQRQAVAVALSEQRVGKVKRNPRPAKPKKYYQVSIMEEGTHTKFMPMALYFTFAEAENYANYLAKQHKNWTIRVHDTRAM
jgi:hypothetical protein